MCTVHLPLALLDKNGLVQPTPFLYGLNDVSWSFKEVFPKMGEALGLLCDDLAETRGELCVDFSLVGFPPRNGTTIDLFWK